MADKTFKSLTFDNGNTYVPKVAWSNITDKPEITNGEDGEDGVGIAKIEKTATNGLVDTYTITYTDDTTSTFTVTNGEDGSDGKDGADGAKGDKGDKGDTGAAGSNGQDGKDGNGIKSAVLNADYTLTLTFDDDTTYTTPSIRGEQGEQGIQGVQGEQGEQGLQGIQGIQGEQGVPGEKGDTGASGERGTGILKVTTAPTSETSTVNSYSYKYKFTLSTVLSQAGVNEVLVGDVIKYSYYEYGIGYVDSTYAYAYTRTSVRGATGAEGASGSDGVSCTHSWNGTTLTVTSASGTSSADLKGDTGEAGADGYTPVKGVDYHTDEDKAEFSEYIAEELAKRGQLAPEYANSVEECTDTSKMYVLPDGYIYAYMLTEVEAQPLFTNLLPTAVDTDGTPYNGGLGYKEGYRLNSSKVEAAYEGACITGYIPVSNASGGILRFKNMPQSSTGEYILYAKSDFSYGSAITYESAMYANVDENGVYSVTLSTADYIAYIRITAGQMSENTIITLNEEIAYSEASTGYAWASTGHAFVPADYEDRIIELEEQVTENKANIETLLSGVNTEIAEDPLGYIRQWDAPIYDRTPVFELSSEKAALTSDDKTVEAVYAKYDALMAENSDFITRTDLGLCSDGETHIYRYDFCEQEPRHQSGFEWSETKPKFIVVTGIHREWNGIYGMFHALSEITTNDELAELRRSVHFIVVPVLSPYSISGPYSEVAHCANANGVEIHRNFEVGFSVSGADTVHYTGESALSEVESQYLDNILKNNTDAAYFLTCHSFDRDKTWGVGFLWGSSATKYMCNMAFRVIDKMGKAWHKKYGTTWEEGIAAQNAYLLENIDTYSNATALEEGDYRIGHAALTDTGGCEQRQATKYGIQATNFEVGETFFVLDETLLSAKAITHGAEAYINFFLTAMGCYDYKDKKQYYTE